LDAAKPVWELRAVFHSAELAFRIGIVVGRVGPAVGLGDAQVGEQQGSMSFLASSALSRGATIQPTT
jgi:hypothetical protein